MALYRVILSGGGANNRTSSATRLLRGGSKKLNKIKIMQSSHDQSANLQSIREDHIRQISLYGKARCRFEIRMMAGEVRKLGVGHLSGGGKVDAEQDDDAHALAKASDDDDDGHVHVPPPPPPPFGIIREHRQSLITDGYIYLPASSKIPLAQPRPQPQRQPWPPERRLSVPLELLTKEWPQLTRSQEQEVSRPERVYLLPTTTTRYDSVDMSRNDSLDDNDQPSSLLLHEISSSSSYSSSSTNTAPVPAPINNPRRNSRGDDLFSPSSPSSSNTIPLLLTLPPPTPPRLPDFEYGELIRQLRAAPNKTQRQQGNNNKKGKQRTGEDEIILQPVAHPFSAPRLHRIVRLRAREHGRLQRGISRRWLFWLSLLGSMIPLCSWLLLLFGCGMMDGIMEWLTEGDVLEFGRREKRVALWVGFVVIILWIGVGIGMGVVHK